MNHTILVTGTSSGFGKLITQTSLKKGHHVIATMRGVEGKNKARAEELIHFAADQPGSLEVIELDVSSDESVTKAIQEILKKHDKIDVLVNNAGIACSGITEGFTTAQVEQVLNVNVLGIHRVTKGILPAMRKNGSGLIINISSVMGRIVIPFSTVYTASKYAVEGYTDSLRYELRSLGIDVALIEPGGFATSIFGKMISPADEEAVASYGSFNEVPCKIWDGFAQQMQSDSAPDPQEVADAVDQLIDLPQGQRPTRTVVDPMGGGEAPTAINHTTDQIQKALLESFGMGETN
jgi:NAD(P)-dependent dehydrogenase (short-subunit alcohol dehydrogenase family)